jgi:hypothetical protein
VRVNIYIIYLFGLSIFSAFFAILFILSLLTTNLHRDMLHNAIRVCLVAMNIGLVLKMRDYASYGYYKAMNDRKADEEINVLVDAKMKANEEDLNESLRARGFNV